MSQNVNSSSSYDSIVEPHLASFDEIIINGLKCVVRSLPTLEFNGPNSERLSLLIEDAQFRVAGISESNVINEFEACDLYPSECRLRRVSYASYFNIQWCLSKEGVVKYQTFKCSCKIPIMVRSKLCMLYKMCPSQLISNGEDATELGGYFIVNGMEKMIRLLIVPRRNFPLALIRHIWRQKGDIFTDVGVSIRCVSRNYSVSLITLHYLNNGSCILSVKLLGGQVIYLPFIYILKALIDVSDYEILQEIIVLRPQDTFFESCVVAMLRGCLINGFLTKLDILEYLGNRFRPYTDLPTWYSDIEIGVFFISEYICIHLESPRDKFLILIEMCSKLYSLAQNQIHPDDPDSPIFQEVLLPGSVYLSVLRSALIGWLKNIRNDFCKLFLFHQSLSLSELLEKFEKSVALTLVSSKMNYFLATGNASRDVFGLPQLKGFTIIAERLNFHRFISHFRSIHRGQFFTELRTTSVRKLLPDAWGFLCPVNTPDGSPCGLLNHLAANCSITIKYQCLDGLHHLLFELGMFPSQDIIRHSSFRKLDCEFLNVLLDGKILGYCRYEIANILHSKLRKLKVLGDLRVPSCLEIVFPIIQQPWTFPGLYLFSTPGRFMRPLINQTESSIEMIGTFEQAYLQIAINESEKNILDATHIELNEASMLSIIAGLTPFSDFNQSPRNMYQCQMSKQTIGTPCHSFESRADNKLYRLLSPQNPLVTSSPNSNILMDQYPQGVNSILAVISHTGYDMEDAIIFNKFSAQRGFANACLYKSFLIDLFTKQNMSNKCCIFQFGFVYGYTSDIFTNIDPEGLPRVGSFLTKGQPYYAYYDKLSLQQHIEYYRLDEVSLVDKVLLIGSHNFTSRMSGFQIASIKIRVMRNITIGDKFSNRHGQKGICSRLWNPENLPFTEKGIIPDILFNPHGFPSRMTIGMLIECIASKNKCIIGYSNNITAFCPPDIDKIQYGGEELLKSGFHFYGSEKMYSGFTGIEFDTDIFIGPIYYQRLRHMISDKFQVRTTGPINPLTHQPVHGRRRSGGLRFGEMERDCLISHGTSYLLQDRLSNCSDKSYTHICISCGSILSPLFLKTFTNVKDFSDFFVDINLKDLVISTQSWKCSNCTCNSLIDLLIIPYVFKLLLSELVSMNIKIRLRTK